MFQEGLHSVQGQTVGCKLYSGPSHIQTSLPGLSEQSIIFCISGITEPVCSGYARVHWYSQMAPAGENYCPHFEINPGPRC